MSRWMVNARGQQFSAASLDELRRLAREGAVTAGDIIQPPGAAEWLYAVEIPELKGAVQIDDIPLPSQQAGLPPLVKWGVAAVLAVVSAGVWMYALNLSRSIPKAEDVDLLGAKGLTFSQVLVTAADGQLRSADNVSAPPVGPMQKDSVCELLGKRGDWYRLRCGDKEGFAEMTAVIPAYFFADERTKADYDPIYNPDRYVQVSNSYWTEVDDPKKKNTTALQLGLSNSSRFVMTDLRLRIRVKDSGDKVLEELEVPVEGNLPAQENVIVGTLAPPKGDSSAPRILTSKAYEEVLKADATAAERWKDVLEVKMNSTGYEEATVDIVEVHAVLPDAQKK